MFILYNALGGLGHVCEFVDNIRWMIEPEFGIGVSKVFDIVGHPQALLNCPWEDDITPQSV